MNNGTLIAAIDLGSNSFRLEIGEFDHGQICRTEYLKETVRLGNGLDEERNLTDEAMQRGFDCLARFGERLASFHPSVVRAVATQTLREARNRDKFLDRARDILGYPIEVISGHEEARLIYQGVSHLLPQSKEKRLIIDIGGRSTELVLGQDLTSSLMSSYRLGSVAWSMKFFPEGDLNTDAFSKAQIAAKAILDEAVSSYACARWDKAYGSSGTIGAITEILTKQGFEPGCITLTGAHWLREHLIKAKHISKITLDGLREDRRPVIGGGISILIALLELLGIDRLHAAEGALRHGLLFELCEPHKEYRNLRATSVSRLAKNFDADAKQAHRVSTMAQTFFKQIEAHLKGDAETHQRQAEVLEWAAQLHEIGCLISHSDYHKHGAYILDNADLDGFSMPELHKLSTLVLGHRGKLKKVDIELESAEFAYQLVCLRLAVILCHARANVDNSEIKLRISANSRREFEICLPPDFHARLPQSAHLLQQEAASWSKTRWNLLTVTSEAQKSPHFDSLIV